MVIDTSALAAILFKEADRRHFLELIDGDPVRLISSVTALEAAMVIEARKREFGGRELDLFMHKTKIEIVTFTADHFEMARHAWRKFGKSNHPAALNFCDCCAYALSKMSGEPLLFKGNDFSRTDVARV
jgi:ribonuclease VapC